MLRGSGRRSQIMRSASDEHDSVAYVLDAQSNFLLDDVESFYPRHHMFYGYSDSAQISVFLFLLFGQFPVFRLFVRYQYANVVQMVYQSGRYVFRFQESDVHRFVSIAEKLSEYRLTDAQGQSSAVAHQSGARLYVNDEQIIDQATGLKRERLTFTQATRDLSATYPGLWLPPETVQVTDYRYDTVTDDSIDDGLINEKRARVLLVVYEGQADD